MNSSVNETIQEIQVYHGFPDAIVTSRVIAHPGHWISIAIIEKEPSDFRRYVVMICGIHSTQLSVEAINVNTKEKNLYTLLHVPTYTPGTIADGIVARAYPKNPK